MSGTQLVDGYFGVAETMYSSYIQVVQLLAVLYYCVFSKHNVDTTL